MDIKNPHIIYVYVCFVGMKHCKDTTQIQNAKQKTNIYLSYLSYRL